MELVVTTRNLSLLLPCLLVQAVRVTTAKSSSTIVDSIFSYYFHPIILLFISFFMPLCLGAMKKLTRKSRADVNTMLEPSCNIKTIAYKRPRTDARAPN